ncbi:ATP-dependent DNA ligase [Glacieibacterium sp.]|uniref:ATP-dependent DNA ligase n=1 Tax=Glacieibacterium sp. TaxID=2860237 RepID=UPI003AFF7A4D
MSFPSHDLSPMEAKLVDALPEGSPWRYEPKWDGFRCLAFRDGKDIEIMSKSGKSLSRYFPEITAMLARLPSQRFVLDGELLIDTDGALSFEALQARLHPAASRIAKLSTATPARLMLFDCLWEAGPLGAKPLDERRAALERWAAANSDPALSLSPVTDRLAQAQAWLDHSGGALDGVVAKRGDEPYQPGERAMLKIKVRHTADCVVGGFRYASNSHEIGSLLLGLYDEAGLLNHIGFVSGLPPEVRAGLKERFEAMVEPPGFTGKAPGGPSRWSTERSTEWQPLRTELVVEVGYDQVTGHRLRHAAGFIRWRPDKAPRQCEMTQLARPLAVATLGL